MTMKKVFAGMMALCLVLITACGESSGKNNSAKSIDDLLVFFKNSGVTVSEKEDFWFQMTGAIDGCRTKLDGASVEIFKFDSATKGGKTILQNAERSGTFPSVLGMQIPCLVNGSFIIVPQGGGQQEKVVSIFKKF